MACDIIRCVQMLHPHNTLLPHVTRHNRIHAEYARCVTYARPIVGGDEDEYIQEIHEHMYTYLHET